MSNDHLLDGVLNKVKVNVEYLFTEKFGMTVDVDLNRILTENRSGRIELTPQLMTKLLDTYA